MTDISKDLGMVRNIKRTNWQNYKNDLELELQVIDIDNLDLNEAAIQLNNAIKTSFENNCRLRPTVIKKRSTLVDQRVN